MHESCCRYSDLELSRCWLVVTWSQNDSSLFKLKKTLLSTLCVAGCRMSATTQEEDDVPANHTGQRRHTIVYYSWMQNSWIQAVIAFDTVLTRGCRLVVADSWRFDSWKHVALLHFFVCLQVPKVSLMTGEGLSWTVWIRLSLRTRESCSDKCPVLEMMTRRDSTERWTETSGTI